MMTMSKYSKYLNFLCTTYSGKFDILKWRLLIIYRIFATGNKNILFSLLRISFSLLLFLLFLVIPEAPVRLNGTSDVMTKGPKSYPEVVYICPLGVPRDSSPVKNNTDKDFRVHWKHFSRGLTWKQGFKSFQLLINFHSWQSYLVCLWLLRPLTTTSMKYFYGIFFVFKFCLE